MDIKFQKIGKDISQNEIADYEISIGMALPADYKFFLLKYNGAISDKNTFDIPTINNSAGVDKFFSLDELHRNFSVFRERIPAGFLPIADASCGNLVCLVLKGPQLGNVFFWDHELEADEGEPPSDKNVFKIADSFSNFLFKLRKFDESKILLKEGQVKRAWANPNFKPKFSKD